MPNQPLEAVPSWAALPAFYQAELKRWEPYLASGDEALRLTVLTLYVKLRGMGLWGFVGEPESSTGGGRLEFLCTDLTGLKRTLAGRREFSRPEGSELKWSSREWRAQGALHFKHFEGWPPQKVQAHIDREGLNFNPIQAVFHFIDWREDGYKDVFGIRSILLRQGWDPTPLLGAPPAGPRPDAERVA